MSDSELQRFNADVQTDKSLHDRVSEGGTDVAGIVEIANASGYSFTLDDVNAHAAAQGSELTDEALDTVTGGASTFPVVFGVITRITGLVVTRVMF